MKKTTMKRLFAILTFSALVLTMFAGCGKQKDEQQAAENQAGIANPLTEISADELAIAMTAPNGASEMKYYTLNDGTDKLIYQMDFTCDGHEFTYRAKSIDGLDAVDMSGMNYDNWDSASGKVGNCDGTVMTNSEAAVVYWLDKTPGINYTLCCSDGISNDTILDMANVVFANAQNDVGDKS